MLAHELCNKSRGISQILLQETKEAAEAYIAQRIAQYIQLAGDSGPKPQFVMNEARATFAVGQRVTLTAIGAARCKRTRKAVGTSGTVTGFGSKPGWISVQRDGYQSGFLYPVADWVAGSEVLEPPQVARQIPHGTLSGHQYYKCKCDECRQAASQYYKQKRVVARERRS